MTRRGRILRDTAAGPGLLVVDDTQLPFTLEGMWKSTNPPAAGMAVDVEVRGSTVVSVVAVRESQLAREQAARAVIGVRHTGSAVFHAAVARFGLPAVLAGAALLVGWFVLAAGSLSTPLGRIDFTFWQVLGAVNSSGEAVMQRIGARGGSAGIYGFIAVIALAAPFVLPVWKDRRAHLAGALPLVLMLVVAWKVWHFADPAAVQSTGVDAALVKSFADGLRAELRRSISIGWGTYLSMAAASYFAAVSVRRFLVTGTYVASGRSASR